MIDIIKRLIAEDKIVRRVIGDVDCPRITLKLLVRLGYEMKCLSTSRCAELLGESVQAFRERGWVQSRIRDALVASLPRVGDVDSLKAEIEQILKDYE